MSEHISWEQYKDLNKAVVEYSRYEEAIQKLQEELHGVEKILSELKTNLENEESNFTALVNGEAGEEGKKNLSPELIESTYARVKELRDTIIQKENTKKHLEESIKRDRTMEDFLTELLKQHPDTSMH